jgi:hypothetical protein
MCLDLFGGFGGFLIEVSGVFGVGDNGGGFSISLPSYGSGIGFGN